ncbi:2-polyprenyl-3-methyl-5-hydroxy-6-metoxy-1,4-benzoquinol methylase [Bradyrhizobium algeriense]|uniref:2-polyprenyl-3-methyl-5-hydroxy-6-metoxy-1, 4-benzoquinol methylase n=1 Tax=Bradyrhizobium algeriense TaxID=634784 RepID=A0ABU8BKV6_9BRAD
MSKETAVDHVTQNMETYNRIAEHYHVTATPGLRAWKEESMRRFAAFLPGAHVVVPGCGDGRDSRFLASLALQVTSFDLSDAMLRIARERDPSGTYLKLDFRDMANLRGPFDGIWASGCLYHLTKAEFVRCVTTCRSLLSKAGVLYVSMKEGQGERYEEILGPRYPGGAEARALLQGRRFYAYYERDELLKALDGFALLAEQRVEPAERGFELWLRKIGEAAAQSRQV